MESPLNQSTSPEISFGQRLKQLPFRLEKSILRRWIRPTFLDNDQQALELDDGDLVCYAMPYQSTLDLLVAELACEEGELPSAVARLPVVDERRSVCFLGNAEGTLGRKTLRYPSARVTRLIEKQGDLDGTRIKVVPISVFWGHQPDREKSIFKLLLSENWSATSSMKKFLAMLFHPHHVLVQFGTPVDLETLVASEPDQPRQVRKLLRLLRVHFNQQRQAIIGPDLSHRNTLIDTILASDGVREAIEKEARTNSSPVAKVEKKALAYAREIASDQSYRVIRFFYSLLTWLWNKLYNGIEVNGMSHTRELAQSHEVVYTPCHRSHIDYLLLSYVLYINGLTPPHIAAGKNLNLPIVGLLLRRAGAFFMRRSFQGDTLYKEVFDEYLHQMFTRGFSVEYFIEGGRSRTGRTLPPRTGMLSMTLRSFQKDSTKPIALLPVYFGYERVLESSSYRAELSGKNKESESIFDVFKIFSSFKHDFGQVTVNFGEPVRLKEFLDEELPGWQDVDSVNPNDFNRTCATLATRLATRINVNAAIKSTNLVALALLSTTRQSIDEQHLLDQIGLLRDIANGCAHPGFSMSADPVELILEEAIDIVGLTRIEHQYGNIISASPEQAINLTYNANNVLHIFALPSLICRYIRTVKQTTSRDLQDFVETLYPYLKAEMFLPWQPGDLTATLETAVQCLARLGLVDVRDDMIIAPSRTSQIYNHLINVASITDPTLERFYIVIALLERHEALPTRQLENACAGIAAQLSALYGINSPDFFEKSLFGTFLGALKATGAETAHIKSRLEPAISKTMDIDVRYNILAAVRQMDEPA